MDDDYLEGGMDEGDVGDYWGEGDEAPDQDGQEEQYGQKEERAEGKGTAPESYEAFKMPEGMEADLALMDQAAPIFKEIGLSQDQAQKLVDLYASVQGQQAEQSRQGWKEVHSRWAKEARADPEIGGARMREKVTLAARARDQFGNKEFGRLLDETGLGNHKEMIRFLMKVGQSVGEDSLLQSNRGGSTKTVAEILYPNMGR